MYTADKIAKYVLGYYTYKKDSYISNLKLQKILYFLQANHLVAGKGPLFSEEIEAWDFGPVILSVYGKYSVYGSGSIPYHLIGDVHEYKQSIIKPDQDEMNNLLDELEPYSSTALLEIIHNQIPWKEAYYNHKYEHIHMEENGFRRKKVIPNELLYSYFSENDGKEE